MHRILVVDDEQDICEILQFNLENEGYEVDTANSAEEALALMERRRNLGEEPFGLLLLDVMLTEMSGFKMAHLLKDDPETAGIPIIFITALGNEDDTVKGLNIGADDYISKPISIREVKARVRAVLRRAHQQRLPSNSMDGATLDGGTISYEGILMDMEKKTISVDGEARNFTKLEFEVLALLMSNPEKVFSREQILAQIWPRDTIVTDRTVDVNITRIRKKIGSYGRCIKTRFGYGYAFCKK